MGNSPTGYVSHIIGIQILTIQELLEQGRKPQIPLVDPGAFRKAPKEDTSRGRQVKLLGLQPGAKGWRLEGSATVLNGQAANAPGRKTLRRPPSLRSGSRLGRGTSSRLRQSAPRSRTPG